MPLFLSKGLRFVENGKENDMLDRRYFDMMVVYEKENERIRLWRM
jgi:hypothetical protein